MIARIKDKNLALDVLTDPRLRFSRFNPFGDVGEARRFRLRSGLGTGQTKRLLLRMHFSSLSNKRSEQMTTAMTESSQ